MSEFKKKKAEKRLARPGRCRVLGITLGLIFILMTPEVWSMRYNLGNDTTLDFDVTVIYSAAMRMQKQDDDLLANINADDGNRSFDQYDIISNRVMLRPAIDLQRHNIGIFGRGKGFYDTVYNTSNSHNSPETQNNFVGGILSDHRRFTDDVKDLHGRRVELLDLYTYGDFSVADRPLSLRLGRQVVSWGESLFTMGSISSAQGHADANELNVPGAELQDIFLPSEQIAARYNFFRNLSLSGYYQWKWEKHRSPASGSYFSTMDYADEGGYFLLAAPGLNATADRISDNEAKDTGQWGIGVTVLAPRLNATEFGLYYINYHEKFPLVRTEVGAGTRTVDWTGVVGPEMGAQLNFFDELGYYLDYQEDINLYGGSFSTQLGPTSVSGEVSYRQDYKVQVVDPSVPVIGFSYKPHDVVMGLVSVLHSFGPFAFVDSTMLMFEVGMNYVIDGEDLYRDSTAWGSTTDLKFSFYNVMPMLDMTIPIAFRHRPAGDSSLPGTYTQGQHQLSGGTQFMFRQKYEFGLKYISYLGDADKDPLADRDYLSFNFKYTF